MLRGAGGGWRIGGAEADTRAATSNDRNAHGCNPPIMLAARLEDATPKNKQRQWTSIAGEPDYWSFFRGMSLPDLGLDEGSESARLCGRHSPGGINRP